MKDIIKKILRESEEEWDWVRGVPDKKIDDPEKREKTLLKLKSALYKLPNSGIQLGDVRYFFDGDDSVQKFDRIVKEIRELAIEYKSYSYGNY